MTTIVDWNCNNFPRGSLKDFIEKLQQIDAEHPSLQVSFSVGGRSESDSLLIWKDDKVSSHCERCKYYSKPSACDHPGNIVYKQAGMRVRKCTPEYLNAAHDCSWYAAGDG